MDPEAEGLLLVMDAIAERLSGVLWGGDRHDPFVSSHESSVAAETAVYAQTGSRWCLRWIPRGVLVDMTPEEAAARARGFEKMLTANRHEER
jgi:hypothetical protein